MSYSKNKKYSKKNKKIYLLVLAVVTLGLILFIALEKSNTINLFSTPNTPEQISAEPEINLSPATEEDVQAAEDNKKRLSEELDKQAQNPTRPTEGSKTSVKPVIGYIEVSGGQVNANGFISTMIEEGGTCTLSLTKGSEAVRTTNTALADAQSTVCGLMQISTSQLGSGEWTATISYSSDNYEGTSDPQTIGL
jgi:cytoskeletal protein RodZ